MMFSGIAHDRCTVDFLVSCTRRKRFTSWQTLLATGAWVVKSWSSFLNTGKWLWLLLCQLLSTRLLRDVFAMPDSLYLAWSIFILALEI